MDKTRGTSKGPASRDDVTTNQRFARVMVRDFLVGGFNPFEKYSSKLESSPKSGFFPFHSVDASACAVMHWSTFYTLYTRLIICHPSGAVDHLSDFKDSRKPGLFVNWQGVFPDFGNRHRWCVLWHRWQLCQQGNGRVEEGTPSLRQFWTGRPLQHLPMHC